MAITGEAVTVVGAGIFGLACAWACARRGRKVRVLEAHRVGVGASGGPIGALSPHMPDRWTPKKQFQFEALRDAGPFWDGIARVSGQSPGFVRRGRLLPLVTDAARALAVDRSAAAREAWGDAGAWRVVDDWDRRWLARAAAPFGVVHETLSAQLVPTQALRALAAACVAQGVEICEGVPVHDVTALEGDVIVAAGVAGFDLLPGLSGAGSGVKGQAALIDAQSVEGAPVIYHDGVYVVAHGAGRVAVGSTSERMFGDGGCTDEKLDAVIERARALCPALRGAPVRQRWAGVRPRAVKPDPMLGPVPGADRVFAALGGFKIGLGIAPRVGSVLAALLDGEDPAMPESFTVAHHLGAAGHA